MIYTETEEYIIDGERQILPGFNDKYVNFVDYILKITEEIWEERAIWVIYETYTDDILIHTGARKLHGIQGVVLGTINTLASFPDRKMGGESVIWSKVDDHRFYSSHRIGSTATNLGATEYGAATGKKVFFRTIADCFVTENRIFEEWLVRDNLHLVQQLGFDPIEMAKRDQRYQNKTISISKNITNDITPNGQPLDLSDPNDLIVSMFQTVWRAKDFEQLKNYYHESAIIHAICEEDIIGFSALKTYLEYLMASFPNANIALERVSSNKKGQAYEVAARWKITAIQDGNGFFSPASHKSVSIPVISHYIVRDSKIIEEWMVFDAFDALCQIYADVPPAFSKNGSTKSLPNKNNHLDHKKMVLSFINEMNETIVNKSDNQPIFEQYFSENITTNISKPFNETHGIKGYVNDFWQPFIHAFPDVENQPYILIGGEYDGKQCVSCTGNFIGTFQNEWLGIPPTNQPTWIRYGANFIIEDGKIAKIWYFLDTLDVMRQAGFSLFPIKGLAHIPPAPMTGDGIITDKTDPKETQKTFDLTNAMIDGLLEYDGKNIDSMAQERFWEAQNMMWYGPAGIGTTKGLKGFQDNHQIPFLKAFPNRGVLEAHEMDSYTNIADGNYSCHFGFPVMNGKHTGDGWLGLKASNQDFTIRVMDFWRREGDRLKENWVFIDMIDLLAQFGVDVFKMLKEQLKNH